MDWHEYIIGELIAERLAEFRAQAVRERLGAASRPPRPPLRVAVGGLLIRLGSWIEGPAPESLEASYRRT
jgi:hypothetical protein